MRTLIGAVRLAVVLLILGAHGARAQDGFGTFIIQAPSATTGIVPCVSPAGITSQCPSTTLPPTCSTVSDSACKSIHDQTVSGGANNTSYSIGTVTSGTSTIDCGQNALQYLTNGGAFTLAAPSNDGSCVVMVINNGSAGAITPSGFTVGSNTGDATDTTNGHQFSWFIWRINGTSGYRIAAHQ